MKIRDIIEYLLESRIPGMDYRDVSLLTALNMVRIMQGDDDDFVIFDNAGGNVFTIWSGEAAVLVERRGGRSVYAVKRKGGGETVNALPVWSNGYLYWTRDQVS